MACAHWKDEWIAHLYGEMPDSEAGLLHEHLGTCADCSERLAGLEATRSMLHAAAPPVPAAPRVLMLGARRRMHPAWAFAGGLAAAAALFVVALAVRPAAPGADPELEARLARLESREAVAQPATSVAAVAEPLTRADLDRAVEALAARLDVDRTRDVEFLLGEINAVEWRTGRHILNSNDALMQTMLASNPNLSER